MLDMRIAQLNDARTTPRPASGPCTRKGPRIDRDGIGIQWDLDLGRGKCSLKRRRPLWHSGCGQVVGSRHIIADVRLGQDVLRMLTVGLEFASVMVVPRRVPARGGRNAGKMFRWGKATGRRPNAG